ncbi:hypothetical protein A8L44_09225 [Bacillus sp. FJAT-27986]|nr:hypothetical protein A8L44_09225 [Bacillus sp. FJAT-27986]
MSRLTKALQLFDVIQLRLLAPRDISVAAAGEKRRSPYAPHLMLFGAGQSSQLFNNKGEIIC